MTRSLLPQHHQLIVESAITPGVAKERGYFSAIEEDQVLELGFRPYQARIPALVVPIYDVTNRVALHQLRPDRPRAAKSGKEIKYETPAGSRLCIDVPTKAHRQLGDPTIPLWITEGARKADAAVSLGLCCIALLGAWGWRGRNEAGKSVPLPDWGQH